MVRVVFAEDNYLVREGTAALLQTSSEVDLVGTATSLDELMVAVEESNLPAVELLVARGAPLDERDARGSTALAQATQMGFEEAVHALLAAGADPNTIDESGMTPLDVAEEHGAHDIAALLLRHGGRAGRDLDPQPPG